MSCEDHIKNLIANHNRRLQKLEEQKAMEGISVDPKVIIEIQDIKEEIEKLQAELRKVRNDTSETIGETPPKPLRTSSGHLIEPEITKTQVEIARPNLPQISLVIDQQGSFIERLPISPGLELIEIHYGQGGAQATLLPNSWNSEVPLPRSYDDGELKWKLRTKELINSVKPVAVPREIDLTVQCSVAGSKVFAFAAVDEFYQLAVENTGTHRQVVLQRCCIGRAGILEFVSLTESREPVLVKRDAHPYVLGAGQGALNLLVILEEKEGHVARSPYYPVVRQGIIRPEDFWHRNGQCFVSPDYHRIAFQSLSPDGNRSSVFTCTLDGKDLRHVAGSIKTSVALRSTDNQELGGWTSSEMLSVFVKDAASDSWKPCLLEDHEDANPIFLYPPPS